MNTLYKDIKWKLRANLISPTIKMTQENIWEFVKKMVVGSKNPNWELYEEFVSKNIRDKNVVLVWNSPNLKWINKGNEIDLHDTVIRFNKWIIDSLCEKDIWNRTTIWSAWVLDVIFCKKITESLKQNNDIKEILVPYPYEKNKYKHSWLNIALLNTIEWFRDKIKFYVPLDIFENLAIEQCKSFTPSSWLSILELVIKNNPKSVSLYWFDFSDNNRINWWRSYTKMHNFESERNYAKLLEREWIITIK